MTNDSTPMFRALGYSQTLLNARKPGRLCRGRERWIEPIEITDDVEPIHRLMLTGACFTDDSAADALRGLPHSGIPLADIIQAIFPRRELLAFMEDGHPADIPDDATHVEMYEGHRAGGRVEALMVRWFKKINGMRELRALIPGDNPTRVRGLVVLDPNVEPDEELQSAIFLLCGMSTLDSPPAHYQPSALPEVLKFAKAVLLFHRDKHGPAIGVYSREPLKVEDRFAALAEKSGALWVRFEIPPMLARWDRALAELRTRWLATREEPFPVPPGAEPPPWAGGRRRRDRKSRRDALSREADGEE